MFSSEIASACDCSGGANPCAAFRGETSIFVGTVKEVTNSNEKYGKIVDGEVQKIKISVDEVFKGDFPLEIITSNDGWNCDNYPFALGATYLIYSNGVLENTNNIVPVGLCSGTSPVEKARASIEFLRRLKRGETFSILDGKIQRVVNGSQNAFAPIGNVKVFLTRNYVRKNAEIRYLEKPLKVFETVSDGNGNYRFENLPNGRYKLNAVLPDELWLPESREFATGGFPSCDNHLLSAFDNGSISGKVVHNDGTPAAFLKLAVAPTQAVTRHYYGETQTDKNGNYTFRGLSEGSYRIRAGLSSYSLDGSRSYPFQSNYPFSSFYFPNAFDDKQAGVVTVAHTEKIENVNFKMPPPPVVQAVSGIVVWEDGTPVKSAVITYRIKPLGDNSRRYATAKDDGSFSFRTFEEFDYEIQAVNNSAESYSVSEWQTYRKDDLNKQIKLVLKPKQ